MRKIGDRLSMTVMLVVCAGTFTALAMASAAKKANLIGSGNKQSDDSERSFHERLKALEKM